jgi:hypothetical protein
MNRDHWNVDNLLLQLQQKVVIQLGTRYLQTWVLDVRFMAGEQIRLEHGATSDWPRSDERSYSKRFAEGTFPEVSNGAGPG